MAANSGLDSKAEYYRLQENEIISAVSSEDADQNDAGFRLSTMHLHLFHGLKFAALLFTVVPVFIILDSMKIIFQRKRRFCLDHVNRSFLRQSSWILDERI